MSIPFNFSFYACYQDKLLYSFFTKPKYVINIGIINMEIDMVGRNRSKKKNKRLY